MVASSLERLAASHPIAIRWHSFELRPLGSPPISPEYRAQIEAGRPRFIQAAKEMYNLTIDAGPFGINSRPALIGAKYAEAHGQGDGYHEQVFKAYWLQAQSIADIAVLKAIAIENNLDEAAFVEALQQPQYDEAVTADIQQAHAYGINSVPSMVFANKYLVVGAQPYENLAQIVEQIQEMDTD